MREFYEAISFPEGGAPNWDLMATLFSSHARITRITPEGIDYLDLPGFRSMGEELLVVGAYTSFYQRELARGVDRYGGVMHVASAYETKVSPRASDYLERGINSLQLVLEGGSWKILSVCSDDQAPFSQHGLQPVELEEIINGQA